MDACTDPILPEVISDKRELMLTRRHSGFSWRKADAFIERLVVGESIEKICESEDMPTKAALALWKHKYPEFALQMKEVQVLRAQFLVEEGLQVARDISDKDEASTKKPLLDFVKWLAEKHDPDTYGQKAKVTKDVNITATHVIIDTGIRRIGDEGYRVDETEKLKTVPGGSKDV